MTPTPSDKRTSGNPATRAQIELSVKQQREQKRQEKLAEYQKQLARRQRSKLVWWVVGVMSALIVVGLVTASFLFAPPTPEASIGATPTPTVSYGALDSTDADIEGVEVFDNPNNHVQGSVDYPQSPPAGGPHNPYWLNCGIYTEPQQNENAVHSMEHGAVWVTYDADALTESDLAALREQLPSTYIVMSPYEGLDSPLVLSAWNHQLKLDSVDDPRIPQFLDEYWRSQHVPEPTSVCTGALDGPGKL